MRWFTLLQYCGHSELTIKPNPRRNTRNAHLLMEVLEDRTLLSLPPGWSNAAIVNNTYPWPIFETGTADYANGVFTVTSTGGSDLQSGMEYAYTTVSGNFDAKMRVTNLTNAASYGTAMAMMVREPTAASPNGTGFFDRNTINGSWWGGSDAATWTFPFWYRIQRSGDVITTYRSQDGSIWTTFRSTQLTNLAATVDVGIAVSANPTATATVDNFSISPLTLSYTTSWVGNTFGSDTGHVGYGFDAITVDTYGNVHSISQYDEGGSALSIFGEINGQPAKLAYRPGQDGVATGGTAVAITSNYEYYVTSNNGVDTVRAASLDPNTGLFNWIYAGNPTWTYSSSSIHGLAVRNNELYISDLGNNKIMVLDANTGVQKRSWSVTRPGPLAFDNNGNLWVVQVYTLNNGLSYDANNNVVFGAGSNEGDQVNAYTPGSGSTPGTLLSGKTISGTNMRPCALYFDSTNNRLLVADNGSDLQIKGFTNLGAGTGAPVQNYTFGYQGGVYAGPNPGAVNDPAAGGNTRFYHLSSVAMDAAGNMYVGMTWAGGELRKFKPDGSMAWTLQGLNFVQTAMIDPADDPAGNIFNVYTNREHYSLDLTKPAGQQSTLVGYTWDDYSASATWASGLQYGPGNSDNVMVRVNGQKYMFVGGATAWKFNGDIAIPTAGVWLDPANNVFKIWYDANNNGLPDGAETTTVPSDGMYATAQYIDAQGGVWLTSGNLIKHFAVAGVDAHGNLIYNSSNVTTFTAPAPFTGLGALVYDTANDVMYIAGSTAEYPSWGNFPASGCLRISVRYDHWSQGNRTPTNTIVFPLDTVGNGIPGINMYHDVVYMDVAGQYLFAVLPWSSNAGNPQIYVYDKDHGNLVTILTPGPEVGGVIGNVDNGCKIHAFKRANSQYLISCEDDGYNKTLIYEWTPSAVTSLSTVAPTLRVTSNSGNVLLNWDTDQSNPLTGYNVYRASTANGPFTKINTSGLVTYNTYTDSTAVPGVTYYYKVTAVNTVGEGMPSSALAATVITNNSVNVGTDTTTLGSWKGVYGSQGYMIYGDATSLPTWAKITVAGYNTNSVTTTTNSYDLVKSASTTDHVHSPIWSGSWNPNPIVVDLNFTDGQAHKVSFYLQGDSGRTNANYYQCVDATTGALISTQSVAVVYNVAGGIYASMNITGHVLIKIYPDGTDYAALSGIFVDAASAATTNTFVDPMRDKMLIDAARSTSSWTIASTSNAYNGDTSRLYPSNTSAQYLTWSVPKATSFSTVMYFQQGYQSDISSDLVLSTSPDGSTWTTQSLTHNTATVVPYFANWNYITYSNSALPAGTNYVRFQVTTPNVVDQIEVGQTVIGYTANAAPTISVAAAAAPSTTTTGTGVALSVTGADDGGASNLIYSWATTGTAPGTVTFSANGTNAAKNTSASFSTPGTYTLLVTVMDQKGATVTSSVNVTYTAALNAPSGLTATAVSYSQINLSWTDNSSTETGFKIERATDSSFISNLTLVTTTSSNVTSYSNTGLAASTTYYYRVRAASAAGDSVNSASASATTAANLIAAASGLTATTISTSQINLAWTDNAANETGYTLDYSTDINFIAGVTTVNLAVNSTSYNVTGLSASTTYYFRVRATNGSLASAYSLDATAKTQDILPSTPVAFTAAASSASLVILNWTATNGKQTGFKIERATDANFTQNFQLIATLTSGAIWNYNDNLVGGGMTYYYRIRATNSVGESANSSTISTTTPAAGTLPTGWSTMDIGNVGTIGSVSYSGSTFTVTGSGADLNGSTDEERIVSYQSINGDCQFIARIASVSGGISNAKVGLIMRESTSARAKFVFVDVTPGSGSEFIYQNTTYGKSTGLVTTSGITAPIWLKLTRVGNVFTAYTSTNGSTWTQTATVTQTMNGLLSLGLVACSRDEGSTITGTFDNVSITTALNPPTTVTATTASSSQINLTWNAVSGATSYNIYRSTTPGGEGTTPIATGIATASYSNTGLTASTTYYYKIAVVNAVGTGNPSIEVNAITSSAGSSKLSGTVIGTIGSASGNPIANAFDGNFSTFFDAPTGDGWAGQNLGSSNTITAVKYAPRSGQESRMVNGYFQVSNIADFSTATTIYTITAAPTAGVLTTQTLSVSGTWQYIRYVGPTWGYGNVVELEFWGTAATGGIAPVAPTTLTATTASTTQINLAWTDNSTNETGFKVERATDSGFTTNLTLVTTTAANATSYNDTTVTSGTRYYYRVRATNATGDSVNCVPVTALATVSAKQTGTVITNSGATYSGSNVAANAFDGNLSTFVDASTGSGWIGLNLGNANTAITALKIASRSGLEYRMQGGYFQVSNVADFSTATTIYTISGDAPPSGSLTTVNLNVSGTWQYLRYVSPSAGFVNVAELEFWGYSAVTAPGQVTGLSATTASVSQINLSWTTTPGATSYNLYRSTTPGGEGSTPIVTGIATNSYSNTGLTAGTTYYYKVAAVNAGGTGIQSAESSATTVPNAPAAPSGLSATTISQTQINLAWTDNSTNETGFKVERATDSSFTTNLTLVTTTAANAVSYSNTGLTAGTLYYYRVRATNTGGDSANTASANATTLLNAPSGLAATAASTTQINLSWTALSGAASYSIYRSTTPGGEGSTPIVTGIATTSYSNTGLTAGSTYYYKIAAVNAGGTGVQSSEASAITIPAQAAGLTANAISGTQINLAWTATTGAATYNVYRSTTPGGEGSTPLVTGIATTSYSNTGLNGNTAYYYKVAAVNAGGTGSQSAEANATTATVKLTGTVISTIGNTSGNPAANAFDSNFTTYFEAPSGSGWVGLNLGGSYNLTTVKYAPRSGQESRMNNGYFQVSNIADFSTATTIFTIASTPSAGSLTTQTVSVSGTWQYVRYVGPSSGFCNVSELEFWGGPASGSTAPVAPTTLTAATASTTQINLAWVDNTNNETGFKVERATDTDFTQNLTLVTTTAANATSYNNTGLTSGTRYYYRVRATNAAGDSVNCPSVTALATVSSKQTGTVIATSGATYSSGNGAANAFDGNLSTFVDSTSASGWVGLDLGSAKAITGIKFASRSGAEYRMQGGYFQVSNVADFSTATTIYTLSGDAPPASSLTTVNLNVSGTWRYIRYVSPTGGFVNISEMEAWGF